MFKPYSWIWLQCLLDIKTIEREIEFENGMYQKVNSSPTVLYCNNYAASNNP